MKFAGRDGCRWELPREGSMRVPGLLFADASMLPRLEADKVAQQMRNVACLPGIVNFSLAMPDAHWGYGFPIGGVAAFGMRDGVISPGGVGYDIACGVRLLRTGLEAASVARSVPAFLDAIFPSVPAGVGESGPVKLDKREIKKVFERGARWAVERGYGSSADLEAIEDSGECREADPDAVSSRAVERGLNQLGTLGSGNHFIELQAVDEIYEERAASDFGLFKGQLAVLFHTGSRGCGYQICDDYLRLLGQASVKYGITLPDRQLACAPLDSDEGRRYAGAMFAAANYAKANRQVISAAVEKALCRITGRGPADLGFAVVYDVAHNMAKFEEHSVNGKKHMLCVHRKGATRAFPPGHPEVPRAYAASGQPVLVPGSMGSCSYVLAGTQAAMEISFGSVCHGAGRVMSRTEALRRVNASELRRELSASGVEVRAASTRGLAEEAPCAYKDVSMVADICAAAGLARKVARMKPIGVIKG